MKSGLFRFHVWLSYSSTQMLSDSVKSMQSPRNGSGHSVQMDCDEMLAQSLQVGPACQYPVCTQFLFPKAVTDRHMLPSMFG